MIGETIGKYRIIARLGRGGMGTVYRAVDQTLDRDVAIKVLNPGLVESDPLKRFRAEAITLAKLNHPNIATLFELGQHGDELLMVMEFVRGETFDQLSNRLGPMSFEHAAHLCAQVLDALGHAHRVGVVHRDMKPANLMLTESGVVKVMDFGIARIMGSEHMTNDGYMMGTPAYMSPEQVMGTEVDGRADLYGVGVILYRLLTSHLPFKADTAIAMVQKQIKDLPTPLRQFRAELPDYCQPMLDRALAKAPGDRFQTAQQFRSALMKFGAAMPVTEVTGPLFGGNTVTAEWDMTVGTDALPAPIVPSPGPTPIPESIRDLAAEAAPRPGAPAAFEPAPEVIDVPLAAWSAPSEAPVALAKQTSTPRELVVRPRKKSKRTVPAAVATVVLVAAIVFVAFVARRPTAPDAPAAPVSLAEPNVPTAGPSQTGPPAAGAAPEAASAAADTTASRQPASGAQKTDGAKLPAGATDGSGMPRKAGTASTALPTPAADPAAAALTPLTFPSIRFLTGSADDATEREGVLTMTADGVAVAEKAGAPAVKSVPYSAVIGIFYSRSRMPEWVGPDGTALPVAKVERGKFGFLKGDRDWVTVRSRDQFLTLRPDQSVLAHLIGVLESRTSVKSMRVPRGAADKR